MREDIDGLPFTNDGCIRAKAILKDEYGKVSEIVHAYVRNIAALPKITGSQLVVTIEEISTIAIVLR